MIGLGALIGIVIYTLANTTVVHFQRFILAVAKQASDELGGDNRRQLRALQNVMTPWWWLSIGWLCYVLLALSFILAYRSALILWGWGWWGAGPLLAWAVIGTNLLDRVWQWPSREMCGRIGAAETRREGKLRQLEPQERAMVRHLLLKRLEDAAGAPVGATA